MPREPQSGVWILHAVALAALLTGGCSYQVARDRYDQGFSAKPLDDDVYFVQYNGKSMEPERTLEKLLRKGVAGVCGGEAFALEEITFSIEEVMHRSMPRYRAVTAIATCRRQS